MRAARCAPKREEGGGVAARQIQVEGWFQFPLTDGKFYKVNRNWPNGEGYNDLSAQVGLWVLVKVKAGTFNALEVVFIPAANAQ